MAAERETTDRLIAHFLADQIGASFDGRISGVTRAGLFVKLDETGADGFIPASTLGDDYYRYDEAGQALIGERTGESFAPRRPRRRQAGRGRAGRRRPALRTALGRPACDTEPLWQTRAASAIVWPRQGGCALRQGEARQEALMAVQIHHSLGIRPSATGVRRSAAASAAAARTAAKASSSAPSSSRSTCCESCGEALHHHRADDLPPYIVITIVGHIVVGGLVLAEKYCRMAALAAHGDLDAARPSSSRSV